MITNTTKQYKETAFQFSLKATEKEKSVAGDWSLTFNDKILIKINQKGRYMEARWYRLNERPS